ncbi:MAG: hypothetical protein ACOY46_02870 [Bacillota bacterium]
MAQIVFYLVMGIIVSWLLAVDIFKTGSLPQTIFIGLISNLATVGITVALIDRTLKKLR